MSLVDLLAELHGVGRPDGEPAAVRQAASELAGVAGRLDQAAAAVERAAEHALAGWRGAASQEFAARVSAVRLLVGQAAGTLRKAAGAANVFAARLETAQQRWQQVRDGAVVGRGLKLPELFDPDIRRAVAEAEAADADAKAAALQLAAELRGLAALAPPLPAGVLPARHADTRLGGWLFDWADRFPHDPLGAILDARQQFHAGVRDALEGCWESALLLARTTSPGLTPLYAALDPAGYAAANRQLADMITGSAKLTTAYLLIDPQGYADAHRQFWLGLVGWETLRTGNLPRWGGQLAPDVAASVATAGGGGAIANGRRLLGHAEDLADGSRVAGRHLGESHTGEAGGAPGEGQGPFPNQLPDRLPGELELAERLGVRPIRPQDPDFDRVVNSGRVKWAVTTDGELLIIPHSVWGHELNHTVLSRGEPVLAAGEADIAGVPGQYVGTEITRHSGHFRPSEESLAIGRAAFAEAGIEFPP